MMQRRILEKQIEVVAAGGDPLGVNFDALEGGSCRAVGEFLSRGARGRLSQEASIAGRLRALIAARLDLASAAAIEALLSRPASRGPAWLRSL